MTLDIRRGDLFDVLPTLAAESVDACVTDGPYGIGFMGREWDTFKPDRIKSAAQMKQRKDPALLADQPNVRGRKRSPALSPSQIAYDFSPRGLAGFQAFTARWAAEVFRVLKPGGYIVSCGAPRSYHRMTCGLEDAGFVVRDSLVWIFGSGFPKSSNQGDGKGTALKPGHEPIALAWKPFKGTIANCHAEHGTAVLNIDACKVSSLSYDPDRWPANVAIDAAAGAELDAAAPDFEPSRFYYCAAADVADDPLTLEQRLELEAARFCYCPKPSRAERDLGCADLPARTGGQATDRTDGSKGLNSPRAGAGRTGGAKNIHPTVKPVELMRWLVRLVSPPGGVVLDPFVGSGTTAMACVHEGRRFVGSEREAEYHEIAIRRAASVAPLFTGAAR